MRSDDQPYGLSRRHVLGAAGLVAAGVAGVPRMATAAPRADQPATRPDISFGGDVDAVLAGAYRAALGNLLDVNTVRYDPAVYNRTGLMTDPPGVFFRAGGGYEQPWTRDASTNSWNAGSALAPAVARNTLWSVCARQTDGSLVVQQDNQWWDQVVWAVAAWHHHLVTGDRAFLTDAYACAAATMRLNRAAHHNDAYGLFQGPAYMQDGIAGYPSPPYDPANDSSFVLDHPHSDTLMCLSTNCVYHGAYLALAAMADALGDRAAARRYVADAATLRAAIDRHLWRPDAGTYGYFVHGAGERAGELEPYQEGAGLAFAVLFGVASPARARAVLATTHHEPHGVVNVWPHFDRFDDAHPGRHNVIVWPMVVGMWGDAAATGGRTDLLARAITDVASLQHADGHFWELYNARSGAVDGGWQVGWHWPAEPDQTWSATGYLRMIHNGLFGIRYTPRGLRFAPSLPAGWGPVTLRGLPYRGATLDVTLSGAGRRVVASTVDGRRSDAVPADATGHHAVHLTLA